VITPANASTTNDSTPNITGTASPGASVTVVIDGQDVGTTTADASGAWSFSTTTALSDGPHDVRARQMISGSTSGDSASNRFTVDTMGPPTTLKVDPTDSYEGTQVTASGVTEPNATVTVFVNDQPVGMATADGSGLWAFALPQATPGEAIVSAQAADAVGNKGPKSQTVSIIVRKVNQVWGGGGIGGGNGCSAAPGAALFAVLVFLRRVSASRSSRVP